MKKLLPICGILSILVSLSDARNGYDEVGYMTFKYGLTSISNDFSLDQHTFAIDFIGEIGHQIKPKLDLTYVSIEESYGVDYLLQTSLGLYVKPDYGYSNIFPYLYGGLGYEYVNNSRPEFDNSFYLHAGVGLEIPISEASDDLHIVTELRLMQLIGSADGQDSEMAFFIGLRLPIGETFSSYNNYDNTGTRGVISSRSYDYAEINDEFPTPSAKIVHPIPTKAPIYKKSRVFADADGDGVRDSLDVCPKTASDVAVNKVGCPIRADKLYVNMPLKAPRTIQHIASKFKALPIMRKVLNIHFELNSDEIAEDSRVIVKEFVEAVNKTKFSKMTVEGYTDSTGTRENNLDLSKRRAEAVKDLMIQYGVDSDIIKAIGKGSVSPIATNDTEIGRALNRRIEIVVE